MKKLFIIPIVLICVLSFAWNSFSGPRYAEQRFIKFDAQTGTFTVANTITGNNSGATATIDAVDDDGSTGTLYLTNISGTFQDDEIIYESALGGELVSNGGFETHTGTRDDGITDDFTAWRELSANATNIIDATATLHSGSSAIKFTRDSSAVNLRIDNYSTGQITTEAGQYNLFSIWGRQDGITAKGDMTLYDRINGSYMMSIFTGASSTDWVQSTFMYKVADNNINYDSTLKFQEPLTGTIYWDDVSIKRVTNAALINGSSFGWQERHGNDKVPQ